MAYPPPAQGLSPFSHTMAELVRGTLRTIAADAPVAEVARRLCEEGIGSLVVLDGGRMAGIVTKTDLVSRVLVPALTPWVPVIQVATRDVITVQQDRPIFDGLLLMIQHGIGHLVVLDGEQPVAVVSERDWLTFQERHPAALLRRMDAAGSIEQLATLRAKANRLVRTLFRHEGSAVALTRLVTEINDRVSQRVIELCRQAQEAEAGPAPASFAWMAMGSEGRAEQTLSTDQDNALVFADVPEGDVAAVQAWFLSMASRINDALEVCGFPRCKGNVMASNPALCLPLCEWRRKFSGYLQDVDAESLLRASIYFDFRCLYGDAALVDALWDGLLEDMSRQRGFLRYMAGHGLEGRPPIHSMAWRVRGWLRLPKPPLDVKKQALAPLVAAVRVLALAAGSRHTHSLDRLRDAEQAQVLPPDLARATESAYDLLMLLRIRQHFRQQARGEPPDNVLAPGALDPLQRRFLEEAMQTVIDIQDYVMDQYGGIELE